MRTQLDPDDESGAKAEALRELIQVGTSAGGARAKAVVAWHPETGISEEAAAATSSYFRLF